MLAGFENFVKERKLFTKQDHLLLAISGGMDSVCLFHLLRLGGYRFSIAHCNFCLRGDESDADEKFVRELAEQYGIKGHYAAFDTKTLSATMKKGTQETARILRYDWFAELMEKEKYGTLLTAHQKSDNTETVFINMLRSTGVSGIHGIPVKNGNTVRPLLFASRPEIESFMKENSFSWRHDASNDSEDYLRNRVRHLLVPAFLKLEERIDEVIFSVSEKVSEFEDLSSDLLNARMLEHCRKKEGELFISDSIFEGIGNKDALLWQMLRPYGFSRGSMRHLSEPLLAATGSVTETDTWKLTRERNGFMLRTKKDFTPAELTVNSPEGILRHGSLELTFDVIETGNVDFKSGNTLYFDLGKCLFPLTLRHWKAADRMKPLGLKGSKKISDILTDRKVPSADRKDRMVLTDFQGGIMALLPDVCSEVYSVGPETLSVLSVQVKSV